METIDSLIKLIQNNYKLIQASLPPTILKALPPTIIIAIIGMWQRYKLFHFLYQTPYIKITKRSLLPEIKDGMGGFHQTTFIEYEIYNPASHNTLIKEQSIFLFPRFKNLKYCRQNIEIDKFKNKKIKFPFNYEQISKCICCNIGRIKIIDIKNRKIIKYIWFKN